MCPKHTPTAGSTPEMTRCTLHAGLRTDSEPPPESCPVPVLQRGELARGRAGPRMWPPGALHGCVALAKPLPSPCLFPPYRPRRRKTLTSHPWLSQRDDSDTHPAQSPRRPCIVAVLLWPASPHPCGHPCCLETLTLSPGPSHPGRSPPPPAPAPGRSQSPLLHEHLGVIMQRKRSCPGDQGHGAPRAGLQERDNPLAPAPRHLMQSREREPGPGTGLGMAAGK